MLVLLANHLNYLTDSILECFFKEYKRFLFLFLILLHTIESLSLDEGKIIKDIRNLFRQEKETKEIKDRTLKYIKNLFQHEEEENYYRPVRVSKF